MSHMVTCVTYVCVYITLYMFELFGFDPFSLCISLQVWCGPPSWLPSLAEVGSCRLDVADVDVVGYGGIRWDVRLAEFRDGK